MTTQTNPEHCVRIEGQWRTDAARSAPVVRTADGASLSIGIGVYGQGQRSDVPAAPQGEEVATVLEGAFLVEAAGESYELSPGEGIIIPPREPRVWTCLSERGALYRVITHLDA